MYELFLLGKLMERPWYGYEFQRALNGFLGPSREVSWGTIYPMICRLQKNGSIRRFEERSLAISARQPRKYAITARGRKRFLELMQAETPASELRDGFRAKLGNFSRVQRELRMSIITNHLDRLSKIVAHAEAMSKVVASLPDMPEPVRANVLVALSHEHFLAESEIAWIRERKSTLLAGPE